MIGAPNEPTAAVAEESVESARIAASPKPAGIHLRNIKILGTEPLAVPGFPDGFSLFIMSHPPQTGASSIFRRSCAALVQLRSSKLLGRPLKHLNFLAERKPHEAAVVAAVLRADESRDGHTHYPCEGGEGAAELGGIRDA